MLKICDECGHKNLNDANFCEKCGIKLEGNLFSVERDDLIEKPIEKQKTIKNSGNQQRLKGRSLNLVIIGLGVILVVVLIGIISFNPIQTLQNQNNSTNTLEIEKNNKIKAVENSDEFKQGINSFVENNYGGTEHTIKYLAVKEIKSDNEIVVVLEVEYTADTGEIKTHHYEGIWIKTDGTWQQGENFEYQTV